MKQDHIDSGHDIDWGKASRDYAAYRPGYPLEFYDLLYKMNIGIPGQKILDLGTGTGVLARAFAANEAEVTGVDIANDQIQEAERLAKESGLKISFFASRAEEIDFPPDSFDIVSAGQSWIYFDKDVLLPKLKAMLRDQGRIVLTHLNWLPLEDDIVRQSEALVLKHNPNWKAHGYKGDVSPAFDGSLKDFRLITFHLQKVQMPFTRESWRGRIRACRGIGASLSKEKVAEFDQEHASMLEKIAPPEFTILHQIELHVFENNK